ncbi:t-SNARE [Basidiobolus meristosporus CBS 931.73]|uniref:t-SNARE n=1 Tax=Basidiobolus meristosporus CBS 931.73 TaxID=1314790 RepID=A0A1Y1XWG9_9FUNG|nr:t-SNARE [Basidiobolus meristosporus CBS 931.73]|eukprot:ORX89826.1 t-SNARE [Basidiobolus meristosporus CBS 931.73]
MPSYDGDTPSQMEKGVRSVMSAAEFNKALEELSELRQRCEINIIEIDEKYQASLDILTPQESAENSSQLRELSTRTTSMLGLGKEHLKVLYRNILQSDDVELRRKRCAGAKQQLESTVKKYRETERNGQENYRNVLRRHYVMVNPEATEVEIEDYVASEPNDQIFASAILRKNNAKATAQLVRDRHQDIVEITRMIVELDSLFRQVHEMVEEQQEIIQHVEEKVVVANDQLSEGNRELDRTKKIMLQLRAKYKMLTLIAIIILVVVAVVIYIAIRKK